LATPSRLSCAFYGGVLPPGHSTIKAWLVECRRDGCHSGRFYLHRGTLDLSDWPSGSWSPPWPIPPPIAQFGRAASSRKSLGGSKLLPFKNDGGHGAFPRSVPRHNPVSGSTDNSFNLMSLWFLLWHAWPTVGPYVDKVLLFLQTFLKTCFHFVIMGYCV
jgi:hypothetical protein